MEKGTITHNGVEIPVYGKYNKRTFFGSFDSQDLTNIRIHAQECNYIIQPDPTDDCKTIRIFNADLSRWGWLKKMWNIDEDTQQATPDYVYGYWQGKSHFTAKYSVIPQMQNLMKMNKALGEKKHILKAQRMKRIFIPDLESEPSKFRSLWKKR